MRSALILLSMIGCGRAGEVVPPGSEGGACYGNGTCNVELVCSASNACVLPTAQPADCDTPVLLWSTSFEEGEAAPGSVGGQGTVITIADAHTGTRVAEVDRGSMEIASPWPIAIDAPRAVISFWMGNGSGDDVDRAIATLFDETDSHIIYSSSAAPDMTPERWPFAQFNAGFEVSAGHRFIANLSVDNFSFWTDIDDVELFAVTPCP